MSAYEKKRIELGRSKRRGAPQTYPWPPRYAEAFATRLIWFDGSGRRQSAFGERYTCSGCGPLLRCRGTEG